MINIKAIGKKKKKGDGKTSSFWGVGFANGNITVNNNEVQGVNIWGQYHDHSGDVNGDMQVDGNITCSGNISVDSATVQNNLEVGGDISADNATLNGDLTVDEVNATSVDSDTITAHDLVVTGNAHFFNLTIDEIKSVGGQIILSAANATIDYVEQRNGQYILAWKKNDGSKGVENHFRVNDQVICQTFNVTNLNGVVENKYYWAVVATVGNDEFTIDDETVDCHYIALSTTEYDGSSVPEAGDKICQLGYRGTDDNARQSAIILSAYQSPDPNVTAPSMVQYEGINSFSLDGKAKNIISHGNSTFTGDFRVVNGNTTTNVLDLITGQLPQIVSDSPQAWIMADSSSKTHMLSDYQNLPKKIQVYLGDELIPYAEWTTGSILTIGDKTYNLVGTPVIPPYTTGLQIMSIGKNTNDITINYLYLPNTAENGTEVSNTELSLTINFTHNNASYTAQKSIPFNVIKASATTQGADAEFDKLMVNRLDFNVTLDNELTANVDAKVYHIQGSTVTQLTNLTDYTADILLSNGQTVTLNKSTSFTKSGVINSNYTGMTNPPTSATLRLYKNNTLVDEATASVKFNAGSVFTITDDAITSAVQQSNTYTDGQITNVNSSISQIQQTADSISTRVTNIENDYVTSSELTQTADNIQLNVYDELKNKTGIDVSAGQITLNGNTIVNGNLTLTQTEQGFTLVGENGITQILPKSIGTFDEFTSRTTTTITKEETAYGYKTTIEGLYQYYRFDTYITLGKLKTGSVITFNSTSDNYYVNDVIVPTNLRTSANRTLTIFEDGVRVASTPFGSTSNYNYTTQGGEISFTIISNCGISTTVLNSDSDVVSEKNSINVTIPNDVFMLIGNDGLAVNFGTSATAYIGAEGTTIKYRDSIHSDVHYLKINSDGVFVNSSDTIEDLIRNLAHQACVEYWEPH